jgi:predicted dehydrogenase
MTEQDREPTKGRKLRMGMVGGGPGAFIGPVHRIAAELDGKIELVAGAFSQSPERTREAGAAYRIDPARAYADYRQMLEAERNRADAIDFVAIVTPNHLHLPVALAALDAGIPVMSDKPATASYDEALQLEAAIKKSGLPYGLTHTYAGYQMVREARAMCAAAKLGAIRKVAVEYFQGWLSGPLEGTGHKQAAWRTDPARSGAGGAIGDIGTHAFHLLEYISGLRVTAINATLRTVVPGRKLDDDCNAFVRMSGKDGSAGAAGTLACSQVAAGEMNELLLRIYGEKGSLEWQQQDPNRLIVRWLDRPEEIHHAAASYLGADARAVARTPGGHPEGYLEAFAVLYREFADALIAGNPLPPTLPGIEAGVRGMRFIERVIESNRREGWVEF